MACGFSGRIGTCPDYVAEVPDVLDRVDAEIRRREELVNFLEEQLQAWSNHPSASTWSVNQIDLD